MSASIANPALRSLVRGLLVWSPLWIVTTCLFGGLGVVYVLLLKQDNFVASQVEVQAAREASISRRPLTGLDAPVVSDRPVGLGRTTIVALCSIAGLVFGLSIVFVVTPINASYQPLIQPKQVRPVGERMALVPISDNSERDLAFQEISRCKSLQKESNFQDQEETPRQKPRLAKLNA